MELHAKKRKKYALKPRGGFVRVKSEICSSQGQGRRGTLFTTVSSRTQSCQYYSWDPSPIGSWWPSRVSFQSRSRTGSLELPMFTRAYGII